MKGQCDEYEMKNILSDYYCETMVDISPSDALKKLNSIFKDELKMPDFKMRFPEDSSSDQIVAYTEQRNLMKTMKLTVKVSLKVKVMWV